MNDGNHLINLLALERVAAVWSVVFRWWWKFWAEISCEGADSYLKAVAKDGRLLIDYQKRYTIDLLRRTALRQYGDDAAELLHVIIVDVCNPEPLRQREFGLEKLIKMIALAEATP